MVEVCELDLFSLLSKRVIRLLGCALLTAVLLNVVGCGGRKPIPPPQMTITVETNSKINGGQVFYFVMRSINEKQFLTDTYQAVAGIVFADPPDSSVLASQAIFPGLRQTFKVPQPTQNSVGFYFMFTDPADEWKKIISQPLATGYTIHIDKDQVEVLAQKSFFGRLWPF